VLLVDEDRRLVGVEPVIFGFRKCQPMSGIIRVTLTV
jgi:hypothetical protein